MSFSLMVFLAAIRLDDTSFSPCVIMENSTNLPPVRPIQGRATTNLSPNGLAGSAPVQQATFGQKVLAGLGNLAGSVAGSSSGVGLLGSLVNGVAQFFGEKTQYERQKEMYAMQRADALDDYERQRGDYLSDLADERAYNSPAAQAARLKAAGINPNTVFGSGSVANTSSEAQNTSAIRGAVAAQPPSSGLGSAFAQGFTASSSGMLQSGVLDVQAQQVRSNIELQKAQMLKMLSETRGIDASTKRQMIENGWLDFIYDSEIKERNQRVAESLDRMQTSALDRIVTDYELKNIKPAELANIKAATQRYFADVKSIVQQYDYFEGVKSSRARSEILDMKRKSYDNAEARFRSSVFNSLDKRYHTGMERELNKIVAEGSFLLRYLWNFK